MIAVAKPKSKAPAAWLVVSEKERGEAIAAYKGKKAGDKVEFTFKAYGHDLLRDALNEIFFYKCAYCESGYGATQPVAIEHYRPKGAVTEGKKKLRGYYWLAADWDNLVPSCTDCNSERYHVYPDGSRQKRGKANQFPIANPKKRARGPKSSLAAEGAWLLDPSSGVGALDPERHLEFLHGEDAGVVRPALVAGKESRHGKESIFVYALDRPRLVSGRRDFARRFLSHCRNTENSLRRHEERPGDAALKEEYELNLMELRDYLTGASPYIAMVRQLITRKYPKLKL